MLETTQQQSAALSQFLSKQAVIKEEDEEEDERLSSWLQGLGIKENDRKKILAEGYTLDDVLFTISEDALKRVGLRGGAELKIWHAIEQHRQSPPTVYLCNGLSDDTSTV